MQDGVHNRQMTRLEWAIDHGIVQMMVNGNPYTVKRAGPTKLSVSRAYYWAIPIMVAGQKKEIDYAHAEGIDYVITGNVPEIEAIVEGYKR